MLKAVVEAFCLSPIKLTNLLLFWLDNVLVQICLMFCLKVKVFSGWYP